MATRLLTYLVGGALVIMWIAPEDGIFRYALIIALIVVGAYVDAWTRGWRKSAVGKTNVVSLLGYRKNHPRAPAQQGGFRERRSMALAFATTEQGEAEELIKLLRGEGMRPVLVTAKTADGQHRVRFEIRLAHQEAEQAKSLINWFKLKQGKTPN